MIVLLFLFSFTLSKQYFECNVPYCAECDETGNTCTKCYVPNPSTPAYMLVQGKCEFRETYGCYDFKGEDCTSCAHGYKRSKDPQSDKMICVEGEELCEVYSSNTYGNGDETQCSKCVEGYAVQFKENKYECVDYSSKDKYCGDLGQFDGKCVNCIIHYAFDENGVCQPESEFCVQHTISGCQYCNSGYYDDSGICKKGSIEGCKVYSSSSTCSECVNDIEPLNGVCKTMEELCKTFEGCETCYMKDSKTVKCKSCGEGYQMDGDECVEIGVEHCKSVSTTDPTKCSICRDGYKLKEDKSCEPCAVDGCSKCKVDLNTCNECFETKELKNNACVDCKVDNCEYSTYSSTSEKCICQKCKKGYDMTQNGLCIKGSVENCRDYYDDGKCQNCENGYSLNNGNTECKRSCNTIHGDKEFNFDCISCSDGYYLTADYTCEKCDENACSNGKCVHQKDICLYQSSHSYGCLVFDKHHKCQKCRTGFTLKEGKCEPNVFGCIEVSKSGKCVLCGTKSGREYLANENFECPEKYDDVDDDGEDGDGNGDGNGGNGNGTSFTFILMTILVIIFF